MWVVLNVTFLWLKREKYEQKIWNQDDMGVGGASKGDIHQEYKYWGWIIILFFGAISQECNKKVKIYKVF